MAVPFPTEQESREVAAIVCLDIEVLNEIASDDDMTLEQLRKQIAWVHAMKEQAIHDPKARHERYQAAAFCFAAAGTIPTEQA